MSEKVAALMNLVSNKHAHIDLNDVPLSTLIEQNSDAVDVNFIPRNNFNNNAYRGNFNPSRSLEVSLIIMAILMVILIIIVIGCPLILRIILNNLLVLKRFSTLQ